MGHPFVSQAARTRAKEAVVRLEARASAELVVAVRPSSSSYLHIAFLAGFVFAEVALALALFLPEPFALAWFPVDIAIAFALGTLLTSRLPFVTRLCTTAKTRERHTRRGARDAFFDHHIARTRTHRGVFVYVSLLERCVAVVEDGGVDPAELGTSWTSAIAQLQRSVRASDLDGFIAGLDALGASLAERYPHQAGDVNELPDEASVA